jgi:hypothetical protein
MNMTITPKQRLPDFAPGTSGIAISTLADGALLAELLDVVGATFGDSVAHYADMDAERYRGLVVAAQDEINRRRMPRRLAEDRRDALGTILGTTDIMLQTNLYLRATRPGITRAQEHIGWHRESFYGPDMGASVNFWMPIKNVSAENAMRYVPESHLIPDEAIEAHQENDESVARFSAGHRIGLLYSPKRIVRGVDFSNQRALLVAQGDVAIFSGALIHGAAENRSAGLRFSVDFRLIAAPNLTVSKQHFASGKQYFEQL